MGRQMPHIAFGYLILLFFVVLPTLNSALAQQYYVQSAKAPVWAQPSFQSNQIMVATRAQSIEAIEDKGNWLKVRIADQQGWMLKMMLATQPPLQNAMEQQQAIDTLSLGARRRPSAYATTAAARGLREKRQHFSSQTAMDFDALAKMESWRADAQSTADFLTKAGKK